MQARKTWPWMLLSVRVILVPVILLAWPHLSDQTLLWLYAIAFTTDYLDGAVARRLKVVTPALRKSDSAADTLFHLAFAWVLLHRHWQEFTRNAIPIAIFLLTTAEWYALDAIRWRRIAGFHMYSAKFFCVLLLAWMILLLGVGHTGYFLTIVMTYGTLSNLEAIAISLLLREDCTDMPSVIHAIRQRRQTETVEPELLLSTHR